MATYDILTQAEAASALGKTTASLSSASLLRLDLLNTAVSRSLDSYLGPIVQRPVTEEHDGGCSKLWLKTTHPVDVTALTEYEGTTATALTSASNTSQPTAGFVLYDSGKVVRRTGNSDAYFPSGRNNVVVVYTAGRFTHTTSSDEGFPPFKQAAALVLRDVWQSGNGMGTETFGGGDEEGGFVTLGPEMLNRVRALVHREFEAPAL